MAATALRTSSSYLGSRSFLSYKLGQEIGAGGNGVVYTVARRPELVAKIQKYDLSAHDVAKLEALSRAATPDLLSVAAWPTDLLTGEHGKIVGFVMPRIVDARPLYELYSPRSRLQYFPSADFRFLVHVAVNIARLFGAVHKAGFICGDVNHSNILVRQSGTVAAVDCDSFQVGDGSRFPCLVGTDLFVPSELLGANLAATPRTTHHDMFGFAVLVFHLLFMGRHPFAGRYLGRGDMPIETAIAESRFAYSRETSRTQMAPPPFTPPLSTVGDAVTELFERSFHPRAKTVGRPSPEAWIDALDALKAKLVACSSVPWHHHPAGVSCPWCAIEGPAKVKLFGGMMRPAVAPVADLESLWARYLALLEPATARDLPRPPSRFAGLRLRLTRSAGDIAYDIGRLIGRAVRSVVDLLARVRWKPILWLALLVFSLPYALERKNFWPSVGASLMTVVADLGKLADDPVMVGQIAVGALLLLPMLFDTRGQLMRLFIEPAAPKTKVGAVKTHVHTIATRVSRRSARSEWSAALAAWRALPPLPDISDLKPGIEALKTELDALATEREAAIQAATGTEPADVQLAKYLASLRIEDAKLTNIGPARCAVLRSWGIDTAADIDESRIAEIPGFGRSLTEKLVLWREYREKEFTPSAAQFVDLHAVQQIDRRFAVRRTKLMQQLREKILDVEKRLAPHHRERETRWADVEAAHRRLA